MTTPTIILGDCLDALSDLAPNSIDSIVTDPPYGLGFMGKAWDALPPGVEWATACLRVLKPGGHLLAFGGTRTSHRLAVAIEDAGFEIRDSIAWLYGSGFPKSHNVGKSAGDAWQGWGTALKPAHEPIVVARKPLTGTVAANVLAHGTGALNIDDCRVGEGSGRTITRNTALGVMNDDGWQPQSQTYTMTSGRWPANVVLDESQAEALDEQTGVLTSGKMKPLTDKATRQGDAYGAFSARTATETYGDSGGASRFFYVAKAPKSERPVVVADDGTRTVHPTVKPLTLMRWLVRLVTPAGGTVLDPFAGSGTTVEAALVEGFDVIGVEREAEYLPLIEQRVARARDVTP